MKIIIYTTICLFIFINTSVYSQDTAIKKYLPLQVGNIWVYYYYGSLIFENASGYQKVKINETTTIDSMLYYTYTYAQKIITGPTNNSATGDFYFFNVRPIRIDSATGNIYQWQACYSAHDRRDSLLVPIGGNYFDCRVSNTKPLHLDNTNDFTVFGMSRKAKFFQTAAGAPYFSRRFVKDIGIQFLNEQWQYHIITRTLMGCVLNGVVYGDTTFPIYTGVKLISENTPSKYSLGQNYPNPFNPTTNIKFSIVNSGDVKLVVYDIQGREVQTLVNESLKPGTYEAAFDGSQLTSGVYFNKLFVNGFTETKKMLLVK
jgi:hypothetical protein